MIYSNFTISANPIRHYYGNITAEIRIGESGPNRREIWIGCPSTLTIHEGMNENLNISFSRNGSLILKEYNEDHRNFDDPKWNIPGELFLLLTSSFGDPSLCKYGNGIIQTRANDSIPNFRMYGRGKGVYNGKHGKNGFWYIGVYRVMTENPAIIKITPAGSGKTLAHCHYLLIHEGKVFKHIGITNQLREQLDLLGLDLGSANDWEAM